MVTLPECNMITLLYIKRDQNTFTPVPAVYLDLLENNSNKFVNKYTRVGTLIVVTIYLQLIQNRYMIRSFTVLQCSHQHCVQPVASNVEVVGYL